MEETKKQTETDDNFILDFNKIDEYTSQHKQKIATNERLGTENENVKTFTCKHCKVIYDDIKTYQCHMTLEERLYYCHHCKDSKRITKQELIDHCKLFGIPFNQPKFFRNARVKKPRSPRVNNGLLCEICDREYNEKKSLEEHYAEAHIDHYKCETCDEGFKKLLEYVVHIKGHSSDNNTFNCTLCQYSTQKSCLFKIHLQANHDKFKKYTCDVCSKKFSVHSRFQEHMNFHTGEKPFQCDFCGKNFMYSKYLSSHIAHFHKVRSEEELKCTICGMQCTTFVTLMDHKRRKHPKVLHVCEVCGKTFSEKIGLTLHSVVHSNEKIYGCSYCPKKFSRKYCVPEHERIHTGVKPFKCPECGEGFAQRGTMKIHLRKHTGERPYVCYMCNKSFVAKSVLPGHFKICKGKKHTMK
ncbi:zinc finger protein OZF-like [Agrilus planipennis]|uniref:Zinc finger protein OZF-like n=1 Tax=Agrilus planipennis TaxID=224129 RepID=A0A7F5R9B0_AGRPL|nr:zinc finger protein OZF-like [Agrilus planipennis]